jgi:opacity protein-like surface antigen
MPHHTKPIVRLVHFLTLLTVAATGAAAAQTPSFTVRAYALGSELSLDEGIHAAESLRSKLGAGLDFEFRLAPRFGLDLSVGDLRIAVKQVQIVDTIPQEVIETRGSIQARPVLAGLYLHPVQLPWIDLYAGPVLGWMFYRGDFQGRSDNEGAFGAVIGLDLPFHRGWAAGANVRYLHTRIPEVEEGIDAINTVQFGVGVAYRW